MAYKGQTDRNVENTLHCTKDNYQTWNGPGR